MTGPRQRAKARALEVKASLKFAATLIGLMIAALVAQTALAQDENITRSHGYSYFGDLNYPPDYPYFNYVNPDAPKGGEISIALSGTFDSMNPYSRSGRASALSTVMYESLLGEILAGSGTLPADSQQGGLWASGSYGRIPRKQGLGDLSHAPRSAVFRWHAGDRP